MAKLGRTLSPCVAVHLRFRVAEMSGRPLVQAVMQVSVSPFKDKELYRSSFKEIFDVYTVGGII